jgi:hypothetical protein
VFSDAQHVLAGAFLRHHVIKRRQTI